MYMAPELLTGVQYGETVDLWSAGAILYEMVTGRKIYSKAKNLEELKDQALRNPKIILPPSANSNIHCRDLLEKLLEKDPSKIINYFDEILKINSIDKENLNLIKIKKAIFLFSIGDEELIIKTLNPVINSNSSWRNMAIILISDYFLSKDQKSKANEYIQLLNNKIKN